MAERRNYLQVSKTETAIETIISKEVSISPRDRRKKKKARLKRGKKLLRYGANKELNFATA